MIDAKSYLPAFKIDQVLDGGCIGQVIASKNDKFKINDYVLSMNGWREYYISNGRDLNLIQPKNNLPIQYYLGAMGMPGLTEMIRPDGYRKTIALILLLIIIRRIILIKSCSKF